MIADVLGVAGALMFGFLLPELLFLFGTGNGKIPLAQNVVCSIAFGLMAIAVLF